MARTLLAEKRSEAQPKTFCQLIKAELEAVLSNITLPSLNSRRREKCLSCT